MPCRREKRTAKRLAAVVVLICSLAMGLAAAQQGTGRKRSPAVRPEPVGEYERCEEQCPPPGLTATPAEIWCGTRSQCTNQAGCGCRLFGRKRGTSTFAYVAEAEVRIPRDAEMAYVCWCTKKKAP
jgi:hypothetical protein